MPFDHGPDYDDLVEIAGLARLEVHRQRSTACHVHLQVGVAHGVKDQDGMGRRYRDRKFARRSGDDHILRIRFLSNLYAGKGLPGISFTDRSPDGQTSSVAGSLTLRMDQNSAYAKQ